MTQLALFTDPAVTGRCPDCGRDLHWLYSPARPGPPWDDVEGADWTHGANWGTCACSPRVVRAVKPLEPWPGGGGVTHPHDCPWCGGQCTCREPHGECLHCEPPDEYDWAFEEADWDPWEEDDRVYAGPPPPDMDDQQLGPVVGLHCPKCRRRTEHVVCESDGATTEYRCSQCYQWVRGVTEPVVRDPAWHQEMVGDEPPPHDDLPY